MNGFCPDGPECKYTHPRFDLPPLEPMTTLGNRKPNFGLVVCHHCGELGHKISQCPTAPPGAAFGARGAGRYHQFGGRTAGIRPAQPYIPPHHQHSGGTDMDPMSGQPSAPMGPGMGGVRHQRPLEDVTCYKVRF